LTRIALSILCGSILGLMWPQLFSCAILGMFIIFIIVIFRYSTTAALILSAFVYTQGAGILLQQRSLPPTEHPVAIIEGFILDLPEQKSQVTRFHFRATQLNQQPLEGLSALNTIAISCFRCETEFQAGQYWRLQVKFKTPSSSANPHSFLLEPWLVAKGVSDYAVLKRAIALQGDSDTIDDFRRLIMHKIAQQFSQQPSEKLSPLAAMIVALAIGDKSHINSDTWEQVRQLGINHLIAISGLHIGLAAGLGYGLGVVLMALLPWLRSYVGDYRFSCVLGLLMAFCYSSLAGWQVSTMRAFIMVAVIVCMKWCRRDVDSYHAGLASLIILLILQPLAPLSIGFWLSYIAFFAIVFYLKFHANKHIGWLGHLLRLQILLSALSLPVTWLYFGQASLLSPVVNLIAIPLFSFVIIPLVLLGSVILGIGFDIGGWLIKLAAAVLEAFQQVMVKLPADELVVDNIHQHLIIVSLVILVIALIPWLRVRERVMALSLAVTLLVAGNTIIQRPALRMVVVDVGHGLAVLLSTEHKLWLFDTGKGGRWGRSAAEKYIVPYLNAHGIRRLNLIISHWDDDHAGGLAYLTQHVEIDKIWVSSRSTRLANHPGVELCRPGETMRVGEVSLSFLSPDVLWGHDNNDSCVLSIEAPQGKILISGDIEKRREQQLVKNYGHLLKADVLVVPHHGSASSSSPTFVAQVQPKLAIYATNYDNHWGFPKPSVDNRYTAAGAETLNIGHLGMLIIEPTASGFAVSSSYRRGAFWPLNFYRDKPNRL